MPATPTPDNPNPNPPPPEQSPEPTPEKKKKDTSDAIRKSLSDQVILELGKPEDLFRVDAHLYPGRRARVNVWRTVEIAAKKKGFGHGSLDLVTRTEITDSFYLTLNQKGGIISTNPPLNRKYVQKA